MRSGRSGALAASGLALLLLATAVGILRAQPVGPPRSLPPQAAASALGRQIEVIRGWQDRVKIDGRDELRSVEIVFDYAVGETRRRVFDAAGQLLSEEVLANQPRPTRAEIEAAFDTIRRDPELGRQARSVNAKFDGGFLLAEVPGEPCGPPARCLQVFVLSESRRELHRRSVVDVGRRGRIAHREYGQHATD
jgi:hypothetical protein